MANLRDLLKRITTSELITRDEAVALIRRFGTTYALAASKGVDGDHEPLMQASQVLFDLLTGTAAEPEDIEAIFPYEIRLSDG